jgi:hypothetical protein
VKKELVSLNIEYIIVTGNPIFEQRNPEEVPVPYLLWKTDLLLLSFFSIEEKTTQTEAKKSYGAKQLMYTAHKA